MASNPHNWHEPRLDCDDVLNLLAHQEETQELFGHEHSKRHRQSQNTRGKTSNGGLSIAWRAPDWALPSLPPELQLSSFAPLENMKERTSCPACGKSRHYFCYNCIQILTPLIGTPRLALPFEVHILMHRNERRSMSTGIHAGLLAPNHVYIHGWREALPIFDPSSTLLLFPSKHALPVEEIDKESIQRIVVVESKWKGTSQILELPEIKELPHVKLQRSRTAYWRYHTKGVPSEALSTIEAICNLCREWHAGKHGGDSSKCRCYDDLLWYFAYFHGLVEKEGTQTD